MTVSEKQTSMEDYLSWKRTFGDRRLIDGKIPLPIEERQYFNIAILLVSTKMFGGYHFTNPNLNVTSTKKNVCLNCHT